MAFNQKSPPGPSWFSALSNDKPKPHAANYFLDLMLQYGDVVKIPALFKVYLLSHPDYIKHVLVNEYPHYIKDDMCSKASKAALGDSMLTNPDTESWRAQRRFVQPVFHQKEILKHFDFIQAKTIEFANAWEGIAKQNKPFNIAHETMRLVLTITSKVLFDYDITEKSEWVIQAINYGNKYAGSGRHLAPWLTPIKTFRYKHILKNLDAIFKDIISEHKKNHPHEKDDLIGKLLHPKDDILKARLTERTLFDDIKTFLIAGHETVGNALSFSWYCMAKHPEAAQGVYEEVDSVLGDREMRADDLSQLTFTEMFFNEALRLYPPIWILGRKNLKGDTFGEYNIPKNSAVTVCPYAVHRHPDYWDDPETFNPQRFSAENKSQINKHAYLAFGAGPRNCIGKHMGLIIGKTVLATMAKHFEFQLTKKSKLILEPLITLKPKKGIWVRLLSRGQVPA